MNVCFLTVTNSAETQDMVIDLTDEAQPKPQPKKLPCIDYLSFKSINTTAGAKQNPINTSAGAKQNPMSSLSPAPSVVQTVHNTIDLTHDVHIPPANLLPREQPNAAIRLVSEEEFEKAEQDIKLSSVRGYGYGHRGQGQGQARLPSKDLLESHALECLEAIAESNQYISNERVSQLLCHRYGVHSIQNLGVRYLEDIKCIWEKNRAESRVNTYIYAFLKVF